MSDNLTAQGEMLTRREVLETLGTLAIGSIVATRAVQATIGDGGAISAQELRLNAVAGPDRIVMQQGRTYLNGWGGYGEPPRRTRGRRGEAPPPPPPDPGPAPSMTWSKVSGPGDVTFADAKAPVTTATFSAPGNYVLQVTADNGRTKASSTLTVKVELPPPPTALTPVVTTRYTITSPLWAARTKALIVSWIPHCIDQINRDDLHAGPRRHRQLHRGGEGAARRAARRAQGLRVLERLGAPDRRGDEPRADGRPAGRPRDHRRRRRR